MEDRESGNHSEKGKKSHGPEPHGTNGDNLNRGSGQHYICLQWPSIAGRPSNLWKTEGNETWLSNGVYQCNATGRNSIKNKISDGYHII